MDYETCLEIVNKLEAVKRYRLQDTNVAQSLAGFMHEYQKRDGLALEYLNRLIEALHATTLEKDTEPMIVLSPQSLLDAEIAARDMIPMVADIRQSLFGASKAPFVDQDAAVQWLGQYSSSFTGRGEIEHQELGETRQYVGFANLWFQLKEGSPIALLFKRAEGICDMTAATFGSVIMHILTNSGFVQRSYVWNVTSHRYPLASGQNFSRWRPQLIVEGALTSNDMRRLHREIRQLFGRAKTKEANVGHVELFWLVNERGGPPTKGVVAFWKGIMHEWNGRHSDHKYNTWKGVQRAYNLLVARLKARDSSIRQRISGSGAE